MMSLPSIVYLSTCGLISTLEAPWFVFNQVTAIIKMSILQTIVYLSFAQSENLERYLYFSCSNYYIS
jgi:hypothetical protein